ncbi:hypothetical protein HPB51_027720 [Rhipicephalus microplus]|uniref:Uncharacterized protein n=1 Tax=Rhipicephalus microplus TaxID=6941 RepID=A0A9J6CZ71_RHIMP|nr:hypothetical protein HPB51_027720 [Rhipicephalus microplus]
MGELCAVANEIPNSLSILEFVCADKGLIVHEEVADEAIVNSVCEVADPDEQRPEQPEKTTSPQDVLHAFDTICTLFGEHDDNMAMNYFLRFESRDIKSLHGKAAKHLVERMLLCMDNSSQYEVSFLSAINMLARAWTRVKEETIANCFRACGFMENSRDASPCAPVEVQTNELDDGSFRAALGDVRFDKYVAVDSKVETCGPLTDSEIVQMVRPHDCIPENDDDDDDIGNEPPLRAADVAAGLAFAQWFFVGEHNAEEALRHVYSLQNLLAAARMASRRR